MSALLAAVAVVTMLTSTDDVHAVAMAGDGTVWAGTGGGLLRLGPGGVEGTWLPGDGLPDGTVRAVLAEGDHVWVGTDRGLARIDERTGEVTAAVRTAGSVRALARFGGALFVGLWDHGLWRLEGDRLDEVAAVPRITGLADGGSLLYVTSTARGTLAWDGVRMRRLGGDRLAWEVRVHGGQAWVATSSGLLRFDGRRRVRGAEVRASRELPVADVRAVAFDGDTPVVGTFGAGVWRWRGGRWRPVSAGRSPGSQTAHVQALDTAGGWLAVGTDAGLHARSPEGSWTTAPSSPLPQSDLTALARTDEGLWVGTFERGLLLVRDDGTTERFDEQSGLVDGRINRLAVDAGGHLWVATDRGVMERSGGRFVLRGLLDAHVTMVGEAAGALYAAAGGALWRWDGAGFVPVAGDAGRRPEAVTEGLHGELVSATAEGLSVRVSGGWTHFATGDHGLPDDWVTAVARYAGHLVVGTYNAGVAEVGDPGRILQPNLWVNAGAIATVGARGGDAILAVGTLDAGLWLYDGTRWGRITTEQGLPDDDVTAVLPNGRGGLWVATRGGLALVDWLPEAPLRDAQARRCGTPVMALAQGLRGARRKHGGIRLADRGRAYCTCACNGDVS